MLYDELDRKNMHFDAGERGRGGDIPCFILMYNVIPGTASLARNVERTH